MTITQTAEETKPRVESRAEILLAAALANRRRGWSVIPVIGKKPLCAWARYQTELPTVAQIRSWFSNLQVTGIALITGQLSGVAARDFDTAEAYAAFEAQYPALAGSLPTVRSGRKEGTGRHVYFEPVQHQRTKVLDDGELRDEGGYIILPPSLHESGREYEQLIPFPVGNLPRVDPAIFLSQSTSKPLQCPLSLCASVTSVPSVPSVPSVAFTLEEAVAESLPTRTGQNHKALFKLARALLNVPGMNEAGRDLAFDRWYEASRQFLRESQTRDSYYLEFLDACASAEIPLGANLDKAVQAAIAAPTPLCALRFQDVQIRLLVSLCKELQSMAGAGQPFYLSCRTAARLLNHDCHTTVARWLSGLEQLKILFVVERGKSGTHRATRFFYAGD